MSYWAPRSSWSVRRHSAREVSPCEVFASEVSPCEVFAREVSAREEPQTRNRRGRPTRGVVLTLAAMLLGSSFTPVLAVEGLAAKRREAKRLQTSIDATAEKIEVLNEDYLEAQAKLETLQTKVQRASAETSKQRLRLEGIRDQVRRQALTSYAAPAATEDQVLRSASDLGDLERQTVLTSRAQSTSRDAEDLLRESVEDLEISEREIAEAKRESERTLATLKTKKKRADELLREYQALERRTQGELAALVEQARKEAVAAEERREREELQRRRRAASEELERRRRASARRLENGTSAGVGAQGQGEGPAIAAGQRRTTVEESVQNRSTRDLQLDIGTPTATPAAPGAERAVQVALAQLGKPYIWAAEGPHGYDCSGLMLYAWRASGKSLPHSSRMQFSSTRRVAFADIKPGDLVFFGRPIHHVGMYIGNGQMVEASRRGTPVRVRSVFRKDMVGVGRLG